MFYENFKAVRVKKEIMRFTPTVSECNLSTFLVYTFKSLK